MYQSRTFAILTIVPLLFAGPSAAQEINSVQLVGDFGGLTCEPNEPENNMDQIEDHLLRKLVFIDEPGDPDTIQFEFTMNGSYFPENWGWSGVWGIAELRWNPPSIVTIIDDSGYYYFHFNDTSYAYWLDRPNGVIDGYITSEHHSGAPEGATVILYDSQLQAIDLFSEFIDSTYVFNYLPPATYQLTSSAPGYRDTTITGIVLAESGHETINIQLTSETAVMISSASYERTEKGVLLTWRVWCCDGRVGFDVYRGSEPGLPLAEKRTVSPVFGDRVFQFFDNCEDPRQDWYYYLVEVGDDNPTRYGPIRVTGITPSITTRLGQNYPNPFNPATFIPFTVGPQGENEQIILSFYDVSGRMVDRYNLGAKPVGEYTFRWNPSLLKNVSLPSGVYYCRLRIGKMTFTRKMILLR